MSILPPKQYIDLAKTLPPRLQRFFARYPPKAILPPSYTPPNPYAITLTPTPAPTPNSTSEPSEEAKPFVNPDIETLGFPNPFRAQKSPITGLWHDPVFSLRRQADLAKLARKHGVEELLPPTVKSSAEKLRKRMENGLRVKGTGIGERVKGKASERTLKGRLEKRRQAMLEMPQMVQTWKERGHGRGWKKWPKK
ncbi:hypothetical protein GLAREA_04494 [Glarea lozoyensis ATCC 20868]|uniref:Large ribosomal subunit protein mL59 domain-containing protein n=2 Tax=Glarea lozoyensis TaxID=101852 RepID=S3DMG4_GLAL2|nr:uncharacterized protein GLAREA_04494 [Glarea lozoyensis ATCC 20868]EHL00363.1 putative 54S ribosomal protein L25, mitochondrial [Glarea lozoyensis 74030]EPE27703.1 hypothetical protein GLAREA_04494 [Glarea lozoyensis ATCC 20868]